MDVIFADPPYALGVESDLLDACAPAVIEGGLFVLQHPRRWEPPAPLRGWRLLRPRRFGDTVIDFFVREDTPDGASTTSDGVVSRDV